MISIIIISKNEEKVLPRLLNSIKKQKVDFDYEIILSDAQSTDKTRKIAKEYGCKVVEGGLPSKGRNKGAKHAKYDLFLFLDSDTEIPKEFLKKLIAEGKSREIDCGSPICKPITDDIIIQLMYLLYNYYARIMQFILPYGGGFCIFVRRKIFNKIGGFNERMLLSEDHDFVTRSKKEGRFRIIKSTYVNCDLRRIKEEGRLRLLSKYLKGGAYRIFFGDKEKPILDYKLHGCNKSVKELFEDFQ